MSRLPEKSNDPLETEEKMKEGDLDFFKTLLTNWMEELLLQADSTRLGMKDPSDNLADPSDRATFESDRNFLLRIRDRESRLFKKIISALDRIKDGTYGICEMCGRRDFHQSSQGPSRHHLLHPPAKRGWRPWKKPSGE